VNVERVYMLTFGIGAALAGLAGCLLTPLYTLSPQIGTNFILPAFAVVVLGGLGSVPGVVVGAGLIALIQYYLLDRVNDFVHWVGSLVRIDYLQTVDLTQAQYLIFGIMLVLMMLFRREGLLPNRQRRRELRPSDTEMLREENQQLYTTRQEGV